MSKVVIGLGTNMGDRMQNLQFAVDALRLVPGVQVQKASSVYETAPVGYTEQPDFLNAVLLVETQLSPLTVLGLCLGIEAAAGRVRSIRNGPRVLDMDVLLYENVRRDSFELTLPHPRMTERGFVLVPLAELFPCGRALGVHFGAALREMDTADVRKTKYILHGEESYHGI
ncbi:MAG: 2-amino-4-hydroxy-6-hydroxymethyldihydropteridine diphosphokinase [Acutalibacteraceae bacterium]